MKNMISGLATKIMPIVSFNILIESYEVTIIHKLINSLIN